LAERHVIIIEACLSFMGACLPFASRSFTAEKDFKKKAGDDDNDI
jgi:hypothetical protein